MMAMPTEPRNAKTRRHLKHPIFTEKQQKIQLKKQTSIKLIQCSNWSTMFLTNSGYQGQYYKVLLKNYHNVDILT